MLATARLTPARPMAPSPAMKPVEVPETTNQPGGMGRAGVNRIAVQNNGCDPRWERYGPLRSKWTHDAPGFSLQNTENARR